MYIIKDYSYLCLIMRKWISTVIAIFLLLSCGGKGDSGSGFCPELLRAVPSDAVCVGISGSLDEALRMVPGLAGKLEDLDYGRLSSADAVISGLYLGELRPILSIDAGRAAADTLDAVKSLMDQAAGAKLPCALIEPEGGRRILVLSTSEAALVSVQRHLESGACILDAPDFGSALEQAASEGVVIIRNASIAYFLPSSPALDAIGRKKTISFLKHFAKWTIVRTDGTLEFCGASDPSYWAELMERQTPFTCSLGTVLPESAEFAVSLPVGGEWREQYCGWLDANSRLDKYENNLGKLRKSFGVNPLDWEKAHRVGEVALLLFDGGRRVVLLRCGGDDCEVQENDVPGFAAALYGQLFSCADDGWCARRDGWMATGPREDVAAWLESGKVERDAAELMKFYVYTPEGSIISGKKGTRINLTKTEP